MAIIKACNVTTSVKNTGKECDTAMLATAMLIAIHSSVKFDDADLTDPVGWLTDLIHLRKAFPLFGQKAPIREITNSDQGDTLVTLDDGLEVFVRYGLYQRQFGTTSGGLCYAKALASFLNSGYYVLEVDIVGQMLARINSDKTYSGLIADNMYAPKPALADLKGVYKNFFKFSFSPVELVNNGIIFKGAEQLLSMTGLIDAKITKAAAGSTTKLKIGVITDCAESDLVDQFGNDLGTHVANFIVINKATGAVVTPTSAAIVSGIIELTGTYVSAQTYNVVGASPDVWKTNLVEGYDASAPENSVDILIP